MSTSYPGNPTATQSPSAAPGPGITPTVSVPADGDPDAAATFAQGYKVLGDFAGYQTSGLYCRYTESFMLPDGVAVTPATSLANYGQLAAVATNGTLTPSAAFTGPNPSYPGRSMKCSLTATAVSNIAFWSSSGTLAGFNASNGGAAIFVLDIAVWLSAVAATNLNHFVGISPSKSWTTVAPPAGSMGIQITGGVGPWIAYGLTAPVSISATYNPTGNKWQRFRLEFFGGLTPQGVANGGNGLTNYWMSTAGTNALVNVASMNGNPVVAGSNYVVGGTTAQGVTGVTDFYCGQWAAQYNPTAYNV